MKGGIAPVVVTTLEDNLVRVGRHDVVGAGNHGILVHRELLDFVETLFRDKRFEHVRRRDTDGLEKVTHRERVVPLGLVHDERKAFLNCRFGRNRVHMDRRDLFGRVDGTLREDELHVVGVHLLSVAPLGSRVQVDHDTVVVREILDERTEKRLDLAIQRVIDDKRLVNQVKASTHRPCSHPTFGKRVKRRRGAPLLAGQVECLLTGQGPFDLVGTAP